MNQPLAGRTVLVTRPRHQLAELGTPLESLGAEIIAMPVIEIAPPPDFEPLDNALGGLDSFDWVVMTSVNGVHAVAKRMDALAIPRERLKERRLAVIGPSTARALAEQFRPPDVVPSEYVSEAIAEALGDVQGKRFLLARADLARKDLREILAAGGAVVTEVVAYEIVRVPNDFPLPRRAPDFITLTSSEAARATLAALKDRDRETWFDQAALVCIGPITAATVRDLGYEPAMVADTYTMPGLVDALLALVQETTNA